MTRVEAQRRTAVEAAIVARPAGSRMVRRVALAYVAALCVAPAATVGVLLVAGHWDTPDAVPVRRVVEVQCLNGRIQHGIDTGRPDGLLLATDTGEAC